MLNFVNHTAALVKATGTPTKTSSPVIYDSLLLNLLLPCLGIKQMYLASDALPDGQTYSGTYKMFGPSAKTEWRGLYQEMVQGMMDAIGDLGVRFIPGKSF